MKVLAYQRVSTDRQSEVGWGMDAQRQKLEALAVLHGLEDVEYVKDEGYSGKNEDRPGWQYILKEIQARPQRVGVLMAASLDRITRSLLDLLQLLKTLEKRKITLLVAKQSIDTSTNVGRMMIGVLGVFAEFEREEISARVSAALKARRKTGRSVSGNAPYGWYAGDDGYLVRHPGEQIVLAEIGRMRHDEGMSWQKIADRLNELGKRSRTGGYWSKQGALQNWQSNREQESIMADLEKTG